MKRDAKAEFLAGHIPGAVYFDIDAISDRTSPLPHMLPSPEQFSAQVRKLGLGDGNRIVVYDGIGLFSAARVWWMLRVFGHEDVAVLDGGLPKWKAENRPLEQGTPAPRERHFTARVNSLLVRDLDDVRHNIETGREQVLDARAKGRFLGRDPEPRQGLRAGHIPGSSNLPFGDLLDPDTGTMLPADVLRARFVAAGIDLGRPIVTSCGSGVSACALALGLHLLGARQVAVYDGSWTEWGGRSDTLVESEI
jgi:thiosulfate/3-mercaptopyruvate sulfurtransferase